MPTLTRVLEPRVSRGKWCNYPEQVARSAPILLLPDQQTTSASTTKCVQLQPDFASWAGVPYKPLLTVKGDRPDTRPTSAAATIRGIYSTGNHAMDYDESQGHDNK